jgi:hypothetical protein
VTVGTSPVMGLIIFCGLCMEEDLILVSTMDGNGLVKHRGWTWNPHGPCELRGVNKRKKPEAQVF